MLETILKLERNFNHPYRELQKSSFEKGKIRAFESLLVSRIIGLDGISMSTAP